MNIEEKLEQIDRLAGMASAVLARQNEQARGDYLNIRQELESFMMQHKKEMGGFVEETVKGRLDSVLDGYVAKMEEVREKMAEQTKAFNTYLHQVNQTNRGIAVKLATVTAVCAALSVITLVSAAWMSYGYGSDIAKKKEELTTLKIISKSDIVRCGDKLCAKTGKAGHNDYRTINLR